jgi:hypothetical protein
VRGPGDSLRAAAALSAAALALHELRYALAPGAEAAAATAQRVHGYLSPVSAVVAVLAAVATGHLLALLVRRPGPHGAPGPRVVRWRIRRAWPAATLSLVAIFSAQEALEALAAGGGAGAVAAVYAHGGWMALGLAPLLGGLVALALRGAQRAVARRRAALPPVGARRALPASRRGRRRARIALAPLAAGGAGRAPPAA